MKSVFVVVAAALVTTVIAQLPGAPACATPCLQSLLSKTPQGCKSSQDISCICNSKPVIDEMGTCLQKNCKPEEIQQTITLAYNLCLSASVTIPTMIPSQTSVPSTTATGSVTATGTVTSSYPTTTSHTNGTTNYTTTTTTGPATTSTGAAATGYVTNGLGVVGAAVAAFLFL